MRIQKKCGIKKKMKVWALKGKGKKAKVVRQTKVVKVCMVKKLGVGKKPAKGWKAGTM